MESWKLAYTKQAQKDAKKLSRSGLKSKAEKILRILESNPYQTPPSYEKLVGDLQGAFSRRIKIQHRIVYQKKCVHGTHAAASNLQRPIFNPLLSSKLPEGRAPSRPCERIERDV